MTKRIIAFSLVLVIVLTICATAFAAKPTATIYSEYKNQKVKRGKTVTWKYKLKSSSYSQLYGYYYRARFDTYICKGSKSGPVYAYDQKLFTGNGSLKERWKVPKTTPKGKYINLYGTFYRSYGGSWYVGMAKTTKLTIK